MKQHWPLIFSDIRGAIFDKSRLSQDPTIRFSSKFPDSTMDILYDRKIHACLAEICAKVEISIVTQETYC